jgi:hypothetical protein
MTTRNPKLDVVCVSRRTDVPGDPVKLGKFLAALAGDGRVEYGHPMFGSSHAVAFVVDPVATAAISWWSKDYRHLIAAWTPSLARYHHHFSFTITGPERSVLEPGVVSTIPERLAQLGWLVAKCRELGQDPDRSIMVHLDPIVAFRLPGETAVRDNLDHVPALFAAMRTLGLSRVHISFYQPLVRARAHVRRAAARVCVVEDLGHAGERELYERRVRPHLGGIRVQTCTAIWLASVEGFAEVARGACVGWEDVKSITGGLTGERYRSQRDGGGESTRGCTCYPLRDVGDKWPACKHGCVYCFSNPELNF